MACGEVVDRPPFSKPLWVPRGPKGTHKWELNVRVKGRGMLFTHPRQVLTLSPVMQMPPSVQTAQLKIATCLSPLKIGKTITPLSKMSTPNPQSL